MQWPALEALSWTPVCTTLLPCAPWGVLQAGPFAFLLSSPPCEAVEQNALLCFLRSWPPVDWWDPGLLLGTEAPIMMPNGAVFFPSKTIVVGSQSMLCLLQSDHQGCAAVGGGQGGGEGGGELTWNWCGLTLVGREEGPRALVATLSNMQVMQPLLVGSSVLLLQYSPAIS